MKQQSNSTTKAQRLAQTRRFILRAANGTASTANAVLSRGRLRQLVSENRRLEADPAFLTEVRRIWADSSGRPEHNDLVSIAAMTADQCESFTERLNSFVNITEFVLGDNPSLAGEPLVARVQWHIVRHINIPFHVKEYFNQKGEKLLAEDIQSFADDSKASSLAALDGELFLRVAKTSFAQPKDEDASSSGWRGLADQERVRVNEILSRPRFENDVIAWQIATSVWLSAQLQSDNFDNFSDFSVEQLKLFYYRMFALRRALEEVALYYESNEEMYAYIPRFIATYEHFDAEVKEFFAELFTQDEGNEQVVNFVFVVKKEQPNE